MYTCADTQPASLSGCPNQQCLSMGCIGRIGTGTVAWLKNFGSTRKAQQDMRQRHRHSRILHEQQQLLVVVAACIVRPGSALSCHLLLPSYSS
jgi:hypothetical protein